MFEYLRYIFNVAKKTLLIWLIAPGVYLMILPFAFSGGLVQEMTEAKKIAMDDTLGKNEIAKSIFGINDWERIWHLEGLVTTYIFNLFFPLLIAISTLVLINKVTAKAEENGEFEFVASLPFSRVGLALIHSCVVIFLGLGFGLFWSHFIYIPQLFINQSQTLIYAPLMLSAVQSSIGGVSFAAFGFAAGASTGKSSWLWLLGMGLLAFEWISSILSGRIKFFDWYHTNVSSFGAYGDPYIDGFCFSDFSFVLCKILIFLFIGILLFKDRSLNLR